MIIAGPFERYIFLGRKNRGMIYRRVHEDGRLRASIVSREFFTERRIANLIHTGVWQEAPMPKLQSVGGYRWEWNGDKLKYHDPRTGWFHEPRFTITSFFKTVERRQEDMLKFYRNLK